MKNKKILAILTISAIVSAAATGCSFGGDEPEEQVVVTETPAPEATATPTPEPTIAPDVQDSTYTSSNGAVSIKLPDATWSNKADEADMLSFESPEQGKILILHGQGEEDMSSAMLPDTQDLAVALEQASDLAEGTEYYNICGSVVDEASYAGVKAAVDSFGIAGESSLKAAAPVQSSDSADGSTEGSTDGSTDGTQSAGTDSASSGDGSSDGTITNSGGFTQEQLTDTNQTRTIYRNSDGHPLVITPDGNGNWVDFDGNTYRFVNNEDVYDQNDVDYYWHGEGADVYYMPVE